VLATDGNAEPCIDELEVYAGGKNVALASAGAKVTASSELPGYDYHKLKWINDGKTGNQSSWISDEKGKGWVLVELSAPVMIDRVVWGRSRTGPESDRVATRYLIEAAAAPGKWQTVASSDERLPAGGADAARVALPGKSPEQVKKAADLLAELQRLQEIASRP
jgi:hypothetical protein